MLLDSSFLIDLVAEDGGAIAKLEEIETDPVVVSAITIYEIGLGLDLDEHSAFNEIMRTVDVIPVDYAVSARASRLQKRLLSRGERIGHRDALIAATALETDRRVVTRNVAEFRRACVGVSPY